MKRVLIANRGEIAVRVIRACKDHGLESVAVYSEEDRNAIHSQMADAAYSLHGTTATETYLNIEKLIELPSNQVLMQFILVMDSYLKMQTLLKQYLMQDLFGLDLPQQRFVRWAIKSLHAKLQLKREHHLLQELKIQLKDMKKLQLLQRNTGYLLQLRPLMVVVAVD